MKYGLQWTIILAGPSGVGGGGFLWPAFFLPIGPSLLLPYDIGGTLYNYVALYT